MDENVEVQWDSRGQAFVWLGDYTDLVVEYAELRDRLAEQEVETTQAWDEYHVVYHEYATLREAYSKLRDQFDLEYARRKHAERRLGKELSAACHRIIEQGKDGG